MSIFSGIHDWIDSAAKEVEAVASKAETELTAIELHLKASAPALAQTVDGILAVAQSVAAEIDPEAAAAVAKLEALFDALIALIEKGSGAASTSSPPAPPQ